MWDSGSEKPKYIDIVYALVGCLINAASDAFLETLHIMCVM
jgi:hypothetical protein